MHFKPISALFALLFTGVTMAAPAPALNVSVADVVYPNPQPVYGPPGAIAIYDPTMIRTPQGLYLLYGTFVDLIVQRSTDRINWVTDGRVFPNGTPWCDPYVQNDADKFIWAPDVHLVNGQYYLYYACSTMGKQFSAIFLATSATGRAGQWTHQGVVYTSKEGDDYNAIDPNLAIDASGRWWLTFGSFWSGTKQTELDPKTGKPLAGAVRASIATRNIPPNAIEAPIVFNRGIYWYLFTSFDICCKPDSNYRVMMGRGKSVNGPFVDRAGVSMMNGGGTQLVASHGFVHGPGGQSVMRDKNRQDVLVYHYYNDQGQRSLGLNNLLYDAQGWPYIV